VLTGLVILGVVMAIPIVGFIIEVVTVLLGLGAMLLMLERNAPVTQAPLPA
jgi:hypothetical protein